MAKLYVIMGKSATGKDTIYKKVVEKLDNKVCEVVTYTTRPIRENEKEGCEYHFVTDSKFNEMLQNGNVIEHRVYNTIHGPWHYFMANDGQIDVDSENKYVVIGTLESFKQIKQYYNKDMVIPIYIEIEDGERLTRALRREKEQVYPKYEELCRRFLADSKDYSEENLLKNEIIKRYNNVELEKCVDEIIKQIIG